MVCFCLLDHRVHVLWRDVKQMGVANVPAGLHEEPAGVSPRSPSADLEVLQLYVHACWVRKRLCIRLNTLLMIIGHHKDIFEREC